MDLPAFAKAAVAILKLKFPEIVEYGSYAVALAALVSPLIEVVELVTMVTASKKDDEVAAKVKAVGKKIVSFLEVFPHVNLPLAAWIVKLSALLKRGVPAARAAIQKWNNPDV